MVQFTDTVTLAGTRITRDGYLVADAHIARTGIQIYSGSDVDRPDLKIVRVYRSPEQVFDESAMASFAHRPVTGDQAGKGTAGAKNWKKVAVGALGDVVARDCDYVKVPLILMDGTAVADVCAGKSTLARGYTCDLDWTPGIAPDGATYDAQQLRIVGCNLTIVKAGGAGVPCGIGDSRTTSTTQNGTALMADAYRTIIVDSIPITTTDAGALAIEKLQHQVRQAHADRDGLQGQLDALNSLRQPAAGSGAPVTLADARQAASDAHGKMTDRLSNAWKGDGGRGA